MSIHGGSGNKNSGVERDLHLVLTFSLSPPSQPNSELVGMDLLQSTLGTASTQRELLQLVEVCCALLPGFREYHFAPSRFSS